MREALPFGYDRNYRLCFPRPIDRLDEYHSGIKSFNLLRMCIDWDEWTNDGQGEKERNGVLFSGVCNGNVNGDNEYYIQLNGGYH